MPVLGLAQEQESPWELTAAGSLALSDGNSESLAYSMQLLASYLKGRNSAYLGMDYFYAENQGQTSSDSLKLYEQLSRQMGEQWYLSQYGSFLKDEVAELDYRLDTSALFGWRLWNNERLKLSVEGGPGYAFEQQGDGSSNFMTARFAQRLEWQISENAKFWQSIGWTPRVDDFSDSVLELDAGIETRINSTFALRTFRRHRIDTSPSAGTGEEDTALLVGLSYDLGGVKAPSMSAGAGKERKSLMNSVASASTKPSKDDGWETTAALGMSINKGNSDKQGMTLGWDSDYTSEERDFAWELDYAFSEDNDQTSTDRLSARLQSNHYLDGASYLGGALGYLRDDLADIDYRLTPSALAGYALIKNETTRWALEAGPTLTLEQTGSGSDAYASLRLAERLKHRINEQYSIKQSIELLGAFDDIENHTLVATLSLDTKLSEQWIWRLSAECHYDNQAAAGRDQRDLLLGSSVAVRF